MRHLILLMFLLLFPPRGRAQNDAPLLPAADPMRRLGVSEFRLPLRDSNERIFQFSPDGKLLAACNGFELRIWSFPDGKLIHDFSDAIDSDCIAFSPDGRELLALEWRGRGDRGILGFNLKSGKVRRGRLLERVRQHGETHYTFLDHGRWICSMDNDSKLSVWDAYTNRLMLLKPSVRSGRHPVASNGVLTGWDGAFVERIDLKTGDRLTRFNNYGKRVEPVCTPDGTLMAGYSTDEKAIVFWKPDTNELIGKPIPFAEPEWQSSQAALSANGKRLVFWTGTGGYFERKMGVYDIESGQMVSEFAPPDIYFTEEPIISPDGNWVFLAGERCAFTPVNAETGQPLHDTPEHIRSIEQLSFTPDGSTLIVGSSDQRRAWNVTTGEPGTVFIEYYHTPYVAAVDNRRALISGLPKGGLQLQDISTAEIERFFELGHPMHLTKFQLSADRKTFSGQSGETYRRWDIATGKILDEWTPPEQRHGWGEDIYGRYTFAGFALGGSRLVRFNEVRPGKQLEDGSIDWGLYELLLEDWRMQKVTNHFPIPYVGHFNMAESRDDQTLVVVTSDDFHSRASNRLEPGLTYLLVWDVITGQERTRVTRPRPDYFSAFSMAAVTRDARLIATCRNRGQIELWHGSTGELIQRFDAPMDVSKLAFSDDGTILASGHIEGSVLLWDTRAARETVAPARKPGFPQRPTAGAGGGASAR